MVNVPEFGYSLGLLLSVSIAITCLRPSAHVYTLGTKLIMHVTWCMKLGF